MNPPPFFNQGHTIPARSQEAFLHNHTDRFASKTMSMNMPILNPEMDQKLMHLAVQHSARVQKFQIDAAIRLLQMEYETIMARMTHQTPPDRTHQEALGAVQTIAMLGSNVSKMSHTSCPQLGPRADTRCASDNDRLPNVACSSDRKRSRDEAEVIEREFETAHPSGYGKLVLTCEVCAACCHLIILRHELIFFRFQTACEIYQLRPKVWDRRSGKSDSQSSKIAAKYGVTAKTVRDIW
jgi:hypothetical protein